MVSPIYSWAMLLIALYIGILFALNLIPHFSVKSLGWLSIKHVDIRLKAIHIKAARIGIRLNLFQKVTALNLINIELSDVEIKFLKKEQPGAPDKSRSKRPLNPERLFRLEIPSKLKSILRNRFFIKPRAYLRRISIVNEELGDHIPIIVDFASLETVIKIDEKIEVTLAFIDGGLRTNIPDETEPIYLFKAIEFSLGCNVSITDSANKKSSSVLCFSGFRAKLAFGKPHFPLDHLATIKPNKDQHVTSRTSDSIIEKKKTNILDKDSLKFLVNKFSNIQVRFTDGSISSGSLMTHISNTVFHMENLGSENEHEHKLKVEISISGIRIIEDKRKSFSLSTGAFHFYSDPLKLIDLAYRGDNLIENLSMGTDSTLVLTAPVFNLYKEHLDLYLWLTRRESPSSTFEDTYSPLHKIIDILKMFNKFRAKITIVDTEFTLNVPKDLTNELSKEKPNEHSNEEQFNVVTLSTTAIIHHFYSKDLRSLIINQENRKVTPSLNLLFLLKNLRLFADGNQVHLDKISLLGSLCLVDLSVSVKAISKSIKVKSVSLALLHIIREVRNRAIIYDNKKFSFLSKTAPSKQDSDEKIEVIYLKFDELLPKMISQASGRIGTIEAEISCKEGLPSHVIVDKDGSEVDLGSFNRGISFRIADFGMKFKRKRKQISATLKSLQCYTVSGYDTELSTDFNRFTFYENNENVESSSSLRSSFSDDSEIFRESDGFLPISKMKKVLNVRDISLSNSIKTPDKITLDIPEVDARIDMFLIWCVIYAKTLVDYFEPTVSRNCSKHEITRLSGTKKKVMLDIVVSSFASIIRLPTDVDCLLELDTVRAADLMLAKSIEMLYARLYVIHPATGLWSRLFTISDIFLKFKLQGESRQFDVHPRGIRIYVPHQFLFYTVIDNIITLVKAIRQIKHNFANVSMGIDHFERLYPQEKPAISFPRINLTADVLGIALENDPFEDKLGAIYQLGLLEQKERLRKWKVFDEKVAQINSKIEPTIDEQAELSDGILRNEEKKSFKMPTALRFDQKNVYGFRKHSRRNNKSRINSGESNEWISKKQAEVEIQRAREALEINMSSSWIKRFKKFFAARNEDWKIKNHKVWGHEHISSVITNKYDILEYAVGPPLMAMVVMGLDLVIDKAKIDNVDDFLHDYGKKQPKLQYTILAPFFIHLKAKLFKVILKDYPLPLVYFPKHSSSEGHTISLQGNIVINEKLVHRKEEMRYIFVPFSPVAPSGDFTDNFYSVYVPRTLTPVKFMFNLSCDIKTDRACVLTWCKSYQSGISATSMAFSNFTKPAIDDSPLGWWDKVALLAHGKFIINIENELTLNMKGSLNPYDLIGQHAGLVYCWKKNVSLKINEYRHTKKLIELDSYSFLLAVPNYSAQERSPWGLDLGDTGFASPSIEAESGKFLKTLVSLTSSDKVVWTLGFLFERNKNETKFFDDNQERTSDFRPHYDVFVTNPIFDWHPDSYTRYRSDYVHLSISVISKSTTEAGTCANAAYLTPMGFQYFFHWWHLMTRVMSLPIKRGKLFSTGAGDKSHIKFGTHLFTVKYQLIFEPLTMSHMYIHPNSYYVPSDYRIAFTGLKGKCTSCAIDLHQRKEWLTYSNKELNIKNKVLHLKMNKGEVDVDHADVRYVNAVFDDQSSRGRLASNFLGSISQPSVSNSSDRKPWDTKINEWKETHEHYDDPSWIDQQDFVELEVHETLSPNPAVRVHPFFYSPKFSYFRDFSLHADGKYPFGHEHSHTCIMGIEKPEDTQVDLLDERIALLNQELNDKKSRISHTTSPEKTENLKRAIEIREKKSAVIQKIRDGLTDGMEDDDPNVTLERKLSGQLSVYSSENFKINSVKVTMEGYRIRKFHNRFIIHNLQLKWDNDLRDMFSVYQQRIKERKADILFMSRNAISILRNIISDDQSGEECFNLKESVLKNCNMRHNAKEIIDFIDENLDKVTDDNMEAENKYLVKLIHPQIQFVSARDPDSCLLTTARDLELRIVDLKIKGTSGIISSESETSGLIESRNGLLYKDAQAFVFGKNDAHLTDPSVQYGILSNEKCWPPWVEYEAFYDSSWYHDKIVLEKNTMSLIRKVPNELFTEKQANPHGSELLAQITKLAVNADSKQYSTVYWIIPDLLLHSSKYEDGLISKVNKIVSLSDKSDFSGMEDRVLELQTNIREYHNTLLRYDYNDASPPEDKNITNGVENEIEKMQLELHVIISCAIDLKNYTKASQKRARLFSIFSSQAILHMLDLDRDPIADFALANPSYTRVDSVDGSNISSIEMPMLQAFNLQNGAIYPEMLRPHFFKDSHDQKNLDIEASLAQEPLLHVKWQSLSPIGGISIIRSAEVKVRPLKVQLDYETAKRIHEYLFPEGQISTSDKDDSDTNDNHSINSFESQSTSKTKVKNVIQNLKRRGRSSMPHVSSDSFDIDRRTIFSDKSQSSTVQSSDDSSSNLFQISDNPSENVQRRNHRKEERINNDLSFIMKRSSTFISIVGLIISKVSFNISFDAPKRLNFLNVHDLNLSLPEIKIQNKVMSGEELTTKVRKEVIKAIVSHSGKIIGSLLKQRKKQTLSEPLKQIDEYNGYLSLSDLQKFGRPRLSHSARDNLVLRPTSISYGKPHTEAKMLDGREISPEDSLYDRVTSEESIEI